METTATHTYAPPVDQLLTLGDASTRKRPDYASMGFGPEHVPELLRMSGDPALNWADSESSEVWAPIHAWRVLGVLRAVEAVEPLLELFVELEDSDWPNEELPLVFGQIGPPAVAPLIRYLDDRSRDTWARIGAASGLRKIASGWPEARDEGIAALVRVLNDSAEEDGELNGFVVWYLMDLGAVEAVGAMERAFQDDRVDLSIVGDWEDVQVQLGLLPARITPQPRISFSAASPDLTSVFASMDRMQRERFESDGIAAPRRAVGGAKAAAKRKAQKAARRKNRRRK